MIIFTVKLTNNSYALSKTVSTSVYYSQWHRSKLIEVLKINFIKM